MHTYFESQQKITPVCETVLCLNQTVGQLFDGINWRTMEAKELVWPNYVLFYSWKVQLLLNRSHLLTADIILRSTVLFTSLVSSYNVMADLCIVPLVFDLEAQPVVNKANVALLTTFYHEPTHYNHEGQPL